LEAHVHPEFLARLPDHTDARVFIGIDMAAWQQPAVRVGIVERMSIAQPDPLPAAQGGSPRAIRAALLPEEAGDFDREYRQVMREATETLDLAPVLAMLERWGRVAVLSRDADRHRRMLDHAQRLQRGDDVATEPWSVTRARLGL
jgi:hypothetical protein